MVTSTHITVRECFTCCSGRLDINQGSEQFDPNFSSAHCISRREETRNALQLHWKQYFNGFKEKGMSQGLAMTSWILFHLDPLHVPSPLTSEYPVILFLGGNEKHDIVMDVSRQTRNFYVGRCGGGLRSKSSATGGPIQLHGQTYVTSYKLTI